MENCIFCKIANGEIPSKKFYEDDKMIIIADINPQAKLHFLAIPKQHYANAEEMAQNAPEQFASFFKTLTEQTKNLGLLNGYRLVTNKGEDGCQSVNHLHIHILGGEKLSEKMA